MRMRPCSGWVQMTDLPAAGGSMQSMQIDEDEGATRAGGQGDIAFERPTWAGPTTRWGGACRHRSRR
jgi:hypothetical protein